MEENATPTKQDMVDRKGAWIERMFDRLFAAILKSPYATLLVLSVILNYILIDMVIDEKQARLDDKTVSNKEMIDEVRRSVQRELPKQMETIQAKQDSVSKNVDTSLLNLNGTLETVRKLIKSKK
jgi:hypothetical protein